MAGRHRIGWTIAVRVWLRDEGRCVYCGVEVTPAPLLEPDKKPATMDHIVPKSRGGQGTYENLVLACPDCNGEKKRRVAPRGTNLQVGEEARMRHLLMESEGTDREEIDGTDRGASREHESLGE